MILKSGTGSRGVRLARYSKKRGDPKKQGKRRTHEHAYNMLLMKVAGALVRGVSMMYATTVGPALAMASVMMAPEADQVKISI